MPENRNGNGRRAVDHQHSQAMSTTTFLRRWGPRVAGAYLLLLSVFIVAIAAVAVHTSHLSNDLRISELSACHRLNLVRAGDNASHLADWQFFTLTAHLVATSPTRAKPAAVKFGRQLDVYASRLTWIPLTRSCPQAVENAARFKVPRPIAFNQALPPNSELRVSGAE